MLLMPGNGANVKITVFHQKKLFENSDLCYMQSRFVKPSVVKRLQIRPFRTVVFSKNTNVKITRK